MIEFEDANDFIATFERIYSKKIIRIPYTTKDGLRKTMLMSKCGKSFVSLPYMSVGVVENKITDKTSAPFMLFETEEGNIISTNKLPWEIRDTLAHSPYILADKIFTWKNLADKEDPLQLFSSSIRRKIRKSEKEGVVIKNGKSRNLIRDFYRVYSQRMSEKNLLPLSRQIIVNGVKSGVMTVFVAYKDNRIIGGATLTNLNNGVCTNDLFATKKQYNKYYVSYLLHFSMMKHALSEGAVYYSFGRCQRNSSVYDYNKQYNGEDIPLYWSYSKKKKYSICLKISNLILTKLPYHLSKYFYPLLREYSY